MTRNDSLFFITRRIINLSTKLWLKNKIILSSHRSATVLRLLKGIFISCSDPAGGLGKNLIENKYS